MDVLVVVLLAVAWGLPLLLLHELGHAAMALRLTRGEVGVDVGFRGGHCVYDPARLERPRAEAWIAAAGPAASLVAAALLTWATLQTEGTARSLLFPGALVSWGHFLLSAIPLRYGAGVGLEASESDGRAIWRILTGGPPGGLAKEARREARPERGVHPALAAAGLAVLVLALLMDPVLALLLAALFVGAWLLQRSDEPGSH
jgi:hypothetical protein